MYGGRGGGRSKSTSFSDCHCQKKKKKKKKKTGLQGVSKSKSASFSDCHCQNKTHRKAVQMQKTYMTGINSTLENMDMDTMLLQLAGSVVSTAWVELPAVDVDAVIDAEPDELEMRTNMSTAFAKKI